MDVLSQSVTNPSQKRKLFAVVFLWFVLLGITFQAGRATGNENEQTPPMNDNSPEHTLRGIEFTTESFFDTGGPDDFGYQWDDSVAFSWKDPTGATPVALSHYDYGFGGPIAMGFDFPFYENTYSEVYISANGFLSFVTLKKGIGYDANKDIPNDIAPNNIIAPFWSDLAVGVINGGTVSTMQGTDGNGDFFAVNYLGISKSLSPSDLLTFQVILYENGDVWFQYNSLAGNLDSSVGLEDGEGTDGLAYLPDLESNLAIRFQRPGDTARVKVFPTYQSGFTQGGMADFFIQIRNTGELGSDTYNLSATLVSGWLITLWHEDASGGLTDTNGDSIIDTGVLAEGATKTVLVRLQPQEISAIGAFATVTVTATSVLDDGKSNEADFQAAIPAGHFIAFGNSAGLDLGRVTPAGQPLFDVTGAGENPSLILAGSNYFYAWEVPGAGIEYAVLTYNGVPVKPVTKLTDTSTAPLPTSDFSNALAVTPDGHIGIVWVRRVFDAGPPLLGENYNVYFAILDLEGEILVPPTDVTDNTNWQDGDNFNVPVFSSPTLLTTSDNRFVLSWINERILDTGVVTDIDYVVYDTTGSTIFPPDDIKNGNPDGDRYGEPRILELPDQRMLFTYSVLNPGSGEYVPAFEVYSTEIDTLGNVIQKEIQLIGGNGLNPDNVMMADGKILVCWTNTVVFQIECAVLTDDGSFVSYDPGSLITLQNPDERRSNFISLTSTDGFGILSWFDSEGGNRLYYAMIDSSGDVITPPIIAWIDNETITVSRSGQGIASIPDWNLYLPIVHR